MYYCTQCHMAFREFEVCKEYNYHSEVDTRNLESWDIAICPYCSSGAIEEFNEEEELRKLRDGGDR